MRTVKEWIGKTDDIQIPPRVKLRVAERADYTCALCTRGAKPGQADHKVAIILGGENRETNLQWLCVSCHKAKTKADVAFKSRAAKAKKRVALLKEPKMKYSKRFDGTVTKWNPKTRKYEPIPQ